MNNCKKDFSIGFSDEEVREFLKSIPFVTKKAFDLIQDKQREIRERKKRLQKEIKAGARKGVRQPI